MRSHRIYGAILFSQTAWHPGQDCGYLDAGMDLSLRYARF